MPDLRWYAHRLGRMGPMEVAHRVARLGTARAEKLGIGLAESPPVSGDEIATSRLPEVLADEIIAAEILPIADRILTGRYPLFGLGEVPIGTDFGWNRDPRTGVDAPLEFGKSIDYRNEELVGDIKYLWEPNRHLHLVPLAQAFRLSSDEKYLREIVRQIDGWIAQCPYPRGPNWVSSLELGIRLINWSWIWRLCGDALVQPKSRTEFSDFVARWLTTIFKHMHFITRYYSKYSSANNHLIGEAAGVFVAAHTWPYWRQTNRWKEYAKRTLIDECKRQNSPDGVNLEQAIAYQQFVLEFLLISGLYGFSVNDDFPNEFWRRIESMLEFLGSMTSSRGLLPMIGDDDEGRVTKLNHGTDTLFHQSLLALGGELFGRDAFRAKSGDSDSQVRWLLASLGEERQAALPIHQSTREQLPRFFPQGGYFVLLDNPETDQEIRAIVDIGPLGYESIAAHGHADALSLYLSVGGRDCLIDPGTYAYHTEKRWRDYFRGTSAHNTIRIDALDQSVPGGNFMWTHHANASCLVADEDNKRTFVRGRHDGYRRLKDPVLHERAVELLKGQNKIVVTDCLKCRGYHEAEMFWHFSEDCRIRLGDGQIFVDLEGFLVTLTSGGVTPVPQLLIGSENPLGGWVSRRFSVKKPSPTVVWRWEIDGDSEFETTIDVSRASVT